MSEAADARYLARALELAGRASGLTRPNPLVGAVVVGPGGIVGEGFHQRAGEPHAEALALDLAGASARGSTLYTNLEPCSHQGRTPPCAARVIASGVRRVVCCTLDPNPLVNGRGLAALRAAGIEVVCGVLEREGEELNAPFFAVHRLGRPLVTIKAATSLDGRISLRAGTPDPISSPAAREQAMRLRARHDAVLVGIGTLLADDPRLDVRAPAAPRPNVRVVVDSTLRTPPAARIFDAPGEVVIFHAAGAPARARTALAERGALLVEDGPPGGRPAPERVLAELLRRDVQSLLVEGGGGVIGSFLAAGLADRAAFFVAPRLIGEAGTPLVHSAPGLGGLPRPVQLTDVRLRTVGPDLLFEGRIDASGRDTASGTGH